MKRNLLLFVWTACASWLLMAAAPQQTLPTLLWWHWLIIIAVFLLIMFVIVVRIDWSSAGSRDKDEDKS